MENFSGHFVYIFIHRFTFTSFLRKYEYIYTQWASFIIILGNLCANVCVIGNKRKDSARFAIQE